MAMLMFSVCSRYNNPYNYLHPEKVERPGNYADFLRRDDVRQALHVGGRLFQELSIDVYFHMEPDMMVSVKPWVEELLNAGYRVVYYSGQMDIIVAYPLSVHFYASLQFDAAEEYHIAERVPWYVAGELAGYAKTAGNFTEVMVRNAGHMVPSDQPAWALDLVHRVTSGKGF
ncbi:hypothetical protein PR048_032141 [Dryococelus australis]|uniref:Serine carboxypeptidase n=1 Tax=Dryococelus australis TaxID=614101 RepID=A0ABQ9G289_9NEOP|nr:hypothetical protein PR048_032141 [Dryococelus australis]